MLDSDLAVLFGVDLRILNQQVTRNKERFPADFAFQLKGKEFATLRSQIVTSKGRGGRRYLPWVFTEHGVSMLSGVLNSKTAVRMNIEIIRTFVRLRRLLATPGEFVTQLKELAETVKLHDDQIKVISDVLNQLLTPPPDPNPRKIGFIQDQELTK